ncbi:MAG: hypothetical protein RLT05_12815 [Bauldia litoralis]
MSETRPAGTRSRLAEPDWRYIERTNLEDFTAGDWAAMNLQRSPYMTVEPARQVLDMLAAQKDAPSFGYQINNYEHCLQAATMALRDEQDEETVVVTLLHDLGFVTCNDSHGDFAAALLRPYVSERAVWMLERHMYFQTVHCPTYPDIDTAVRERWRGHPWFEWSADWVRKYDIASIDAAIENAPLSVFEPMVHRIFARPPEAPPIPA